MKLFNKMAPRRASKGPPAAASAWWGIGTAIGLVVLWHLVTSPAWGGSLDDLDINGWQRSLERHDAWSEGLVRREQDRFEDQQRDFEHRQQELRLEALERRQQQLERDRGGFDYPTF